MTLMAKDERDEQARGDACQDTLLELGADGYWEQDAAHRFTFVAGRCFELDGLDVSKMIGQPRWKAGALPVGPDKTWDSHKAVLQARLPFDNFIYKRITPEG